MSQENLQFNDDFKYKLLSFLESYRFSPYQIKQVCQAVELLLMQEKEETDNAIAEEREYTRTEVKKAAAAISKLNTKLNDEILARTKEDVKTKEMLEGFVSWKWFAGTLVTVGVALIGAYIK